jgi:hypothetical protein
VHNRDRKEEQKQAKMPSLPPTVSPKQRCFSPQPVIPAFCNHPVEINIKNDLEEFSNIKEMLKEMRKTNQKILPSNFQKRENSSFVNRTIFPMQIQRPSKKLEEIRNISKHRNRSQSRNQTISQPKKFSIIASSALHKRISSGR